MPRRTLLWALVCDPVRPCRVAKVARLRNICERRLPVKRDGGALGRRRTLAYGFSGVGRMRLKVDAVLCKKLIEGIAKPFFNACPGKGALGFNQRSERGRYILVLSKRYGRVREQQ